VGDYKTAVETPRKGAEKEKEEVAREKLQRRIIMLREDGDEQQ